MNTIKGRRILYLLPVGFLFLMVFQEFLHNHQPDLDHHANCPVFMLQQVIHYIPAVTTALLIACWVVLCHCSLVDVIYKNRLVLNTLGSRGPPFLR